MEDLPAFIVMTFFGLTSFLLLILSYHQSRQAHVLGVRPQRLHWSRFNLGDQRCPPEFASRVKRTNWLITFNLVAFIASLAVLLVLRVT